MLLQNAYLPFLLLGAALVCSLEARRIRVRPQEDQDEDYYESVPQDSQEQRVVYISAADQYNGLFGQPSPNSRSSQSNYIDPSRSGLSSSKARTKDTAKPPPVQTIRNYNKVNDDGSFTFGYEAADGSFKEETRGTDCVVRGKYGYVDPDGNKREFTYVSGNPCDPNAPKEEEEQDDRAREEDRDDGDNIPNYPTRPIRPTLSDSDIISNYPSRPIRPLRPVATTEAPRSPLTLFQNNYVRDEDEDEELELKPQPIQPARSRPVFIPRPQYVPDRVTESPAVYRQPQLYSSIPSSTPSSLIYKNTITPLNITPRPTARPETITTYRPQTLQFAVTPKPSLLYTKPVASYTPTPISTYTPRPISSYTIKPISSYTTPKPIYTYTTPSTLQPVKSNIDFDAEFQKFQHENDVSPTPTTSLPKAVTPSASKAVSSPITTSGPVYSSALLYDPSSGQYNTQLYQTLPQTQGDITVNQKIQPYVHQPQPQVVNFQQLQQQSPLYKARPGLNQALYQQQQSELQFQNSAQLYAQQQKARQHQQQQVQQPEVQQPLQQPSSPQRFYYIQPQSTYSGSQIDAFLRGHNIQF